MKSFVNDYTKKVHHNYEWKNLMFNERHTIRRDYSSEWWFDAIKIPIYEIDNVQSIEISTCIEILWSIPFDLLKRLVLYLGKTPIRSKSHYIISIPQELYSNNGILLFALNNFNNIHIKICTFDKKLRNTFSLFVNSQFYDTPNLSQVESARYHNGYKIFDAQYKEERKPTRIENTVNKYLVFDAFSKSNIIAADLYGLAGFFIEYPNTCNIGFKFNVYSNDFISYNDELVRYYSKNIYNNWSEEHYMTLVYLQRQYGLPKETLKEIIKYIDKSGMFWIPLSPGKSWTEDFKDEKIRVQKNCKIKFNFDIEQKNKIYFVDKGALIYENGEIRDVDL